MRDAFERCAAYVAPTRPELNPAIEPGMRSRSNDAQAGLNERVTRVTFLIAEETSGLSIMPNGRISDSVARMTRTLFGEETILARPFEKVRQNQGWTESLKKLGSGCAQRTCRFGQAPQGQQRNSRMHPSANHQAQPMMHGYVAPPDYAQQNFQRSNPHQDFNPPYQPTFSANAVPPSQAPQAARVLQKNKALIGFQGDTELPQSNTLNLLRNFWAQP